MNSSLAFRIVPAVALVLAIASCSKESEEAGKQTSAGQLGYNNASSATHASSDLDKQAIDAAMGHFLTHWEKCAESYASVTGGKYDYYGRARDNTLYTEARSLQPYLVTNERNVMGSPIRTPLTEADKLNGIKYKGVVLFKFGALRTYDINDATWTEWKAVEGARWPLEITFTNNSWSVKRWGMDLDGDMMDQRRPVKCTDLPKTITSAEMQAKMDAERKRVEEIQPKLKGK